MNALKCFRISLGIVGTAVLLVAAAHVAWYDFWRRYPEMGGINELQWRFLRLLNYSLAILQLFMATTTLGAALWRSAGLAPLRALAAALFAFWCARFGFELILPVPIPFFTLPSPSWLFEVLIAVILVVLATPEVLLRTGLARR